MKNLICALSLAASIAYGAEKLLPLMPMPEKVFLTGAGALPMNKPLRVAWPEYSDARLRAAADRLVVRISRQTGVPIIHLASDTLPTLVIHCQNGGPEWPTLGEDESYELKVAQDGVQLRAATVTGALRGMATFAQLVIPGAQGFEVPAVTVADKPRFPWRGLMLDVSRHWMPVDVVERNLDAMAAVKLNVFHWHLSDDQGFRVQSEHLPYLQQRGSDGHFYTQDQIRHVIEFARDRGIRVVPEFDIPAHTTAWFVGYPEFASGPAPNGGPYEIERRWGVFKPTMDPSREETYTFLDSFLQEMTALFPDPYFHIGGDEVEGSQWKQSENIQKFAREHGLKDQQAIHGYFNQRVQAILKKYGKTMIGWDEVLQPGLAPDTVIQSWRGQKSLAVTAKTGYRGLLSYGYYLDHLRPASYHYAIEPFSDAADLTPEQSARILGGEACMWNEYVSAETVDSRIWPRMAAIAERFWSPREITDVPSMYTRMEIVSRQLDAVGLKHHTYQDSMLMRLAGSGSVEPLRVLADATESAGVESRRRARKYTSLDPLNRFVDAVHPDSEYIHELELAATRIANGAGSLADFAALTAAFHAWSLAGGPRFDAIGNPALDELKPLSKNLTQTAAIGSEALAFFVNGHAAPPTGWSAQKIQLLDQMAKPVAEITLAAVRPVKILVEATSRAKLANGAANR